MMRAHTRGLVCRHCGLSFMQLAMLDAIAPADHEHDLMPRDEYEMERADAILAAICEPKAESEGR